MGLKGLLVATWLVVGIMAYALAGFPVISLTYDHMHTDTVNEQGYGDDAVFVRDVAIVFVPTVFVVGIIVYAYAAIQREESFFGAGPRSPPR